MKSEHRFLLNQKELLSVLAAMQPICAKRTTFDTTASILFCVNHKELVLKATDLEISLQVSCDLLHNATGGEVQFLIPGKRIFEIVKELDETITFSFDNNQLLVSSGSVEFTLHSKDAADFPPFPERIENLVHLDATQVQEYLDKVAFLVPQNNTNPALNGVLMELGPLGLVLTATDGHCLAQVRAAQIQLEAAHTWLLPRRAVFELRKLLETNVAKPLFLGRCGSQLVFSGPSFNFFTKLLVNQFPDYRSVLDRTSFVPATVDRVDFTKALRRAASLLSGQFLATQFGFEKQTLHVSMNNKDVGALKEELPINGEQAAGLGIKFYAPYLLNGLHAFTDEQVTLYLKNATCPAILEAAQPEYQFTYLVMPVSLTT